MCGFAKVCFLVCLFVASSLFIFGQDNPPKRGESVDLPPGASGDWWATVQQNIEREEYNITSAAAESGFLFQAPNRAQGFRIEFSEKGIVVSPLSNDKAGWSWGLELIERAQDSRHKADVTVKGNRLEIGRENITEWYINSPDGLEQGFTINKPLGHDGKLNIDMKLKGGLHPKFAEDGQAIDFYDNSHVAVLSYSKLIVTDAAGVVLPSKFEAVNGGIRISVDDKDAVYPVTIDPIATLPSWTAEGNQSYDCFGFSVATAGDVNGDGYSDVIVGAYSFSNGETYEGRAYLYLGSAGGLPVFPSWVAESNQGGAYFGYSVSTAGDVNGDGYSDVIVGAPGFSSGESFEGRAFLYLGSATGLSPSPSWTAESNKANGEFGISVATAGDVNSDGYSDVIVGAYTYSNGQSDEGRAYLYLGAASGLSPSPSWTAEGNQETAYFGCSVSTAGDVNGDGYSDVIVGAHYYDNGETNEGAAFLYLGCPSGLSASPSWTAEGDQANAYFGFSVATAGDVNGDGYGDIIVGAYFYDNGETDEGRAFVYLGSPSGLSTSPSWMAESNQAGSKFGYSVATAGDVNGDGYGDVIVGAIGYTNGESIEGGAFLYMGSASGLAVSPSWTGESNQPGGAFGWSVGTAGDVNGDGFSDILIGAPYYTNGTITAGGRAYLYLGGSSGLSTSQGWNASGEDWDNYFGYTVSSAGDVNGDGYSDVVVGALGYDGSRGKAYLFPGSATGLSTSVSWSKVGEAAGDYFGASVASAGDVNGDGYSDVLIGAYGYSSSTGRTYLYSGGASGLSSSASWTATGESANSYFGFKAAVAGDVNGDGYSDVLVGAYGYSGNTGKAYCFKGSAAGLSSVASWTAAGQTAGDRFGYSLSTAGDIDGDGYSEIVVGADGYGSYIGRAYLYQGGVSGPSVSPSWMTTGEAAGNYYGHSLASAGDVNGDGYSDLIVAASYFGSYLGKIYVYYGSWSGLPTTASFALAGEYDYDEFGISVASAGDVNGDGYSDVVVGADGYGSYSGRAYLFLGSAAGLAASSSWTATGEYSSNRLGLSVASAGDVNGDGYTDMITGACWHNGKIGRAYLFYGNGGPGVPLRPQQLRNDLSAPISAGGNAYELKFRIGLTLKSPSGKAWSKLQWQIAPWGSVFAPSVNPIQSDGSWYYNPVRRTAPITLQEDLVRYTWRARVKYHPAKSPFIPWSRWFTIPDNGLYQTDLISTSATEPYPPSGCVLPDEPCFIYLVTQGGGNYTLNWQDPNQENQRTGWNVRRSNNPALTPKSSWPLMGTNVVDSDEGTANYQWTDSSGDDPAPSTVWYYLVTTYNDNCPAEGPFASN